MEERAVESVEHKVDRAWYEDVCRDTQKNKERVRQREAARLREELIHKIHFNSQIGQNTCTLTPSLHLDVDKEVLEPFKNAGFKVKDNDTDIGFYYIISWGEE